MTVEGTTPYGYSPQVASYNVDAVMDMPPPVMPPDYEPVTVHPLRFQITNQNMAWLIGGMAAAFAFSKVVKVGALSKVGFYAGLGAVGLAVSDFIGIFTINDLKRMLPI